MTKQKKKGMCKNGNFCTTDKIVAATESVDLFGVDINFNYDGKHVIKSIPGTLMSFLLVFVLMTFALQRFQELVNHS